jgi:hypothetical protein
MTFHGNYVAQAHAARDNPAGHHAVIRGELVQTIGEVQAGAYRTMIKE